MPSRDLRVTSDDHGIPSMQSESRKIPFSAQQISSAGSKISNEKAVLVLQE
jgi:hypothetical protein